ncbi:MAG TPA: hypothetical protein VIE43_20865 [Thermoanaerobaculia bacterium]|jgi:hypothetical protein|nr:hypothetical protein [Thermoanaerobaculia bacterium]
MNRSRQKTLLLIFGAVVLIAAWHFVGPMLGFGGGAASDDAAGSATTPKRPAADGEGDEAPRPGRRTVVEHHAARPGDRVAVLRLADLDHPALPSKAGRDPWRYVDPPPPPPPPPPPVHKPTAEELRAEEEARRRAEEEARKRAIEAAKPHPAAFTLQYLGRFGPPDREIAVFTNGKTVINKQEGEVIDNKFIVSHIGYESVDIRFVGFPDVPAKRVGVTPRRQSPVGGNPG